MFDYDWPASRYKLPPKRPNYERVIYGLDELCLAAAQGRGSRIVLEGQLRLERAELLNEQFLCRVAVRGVSPGQLPVVGEIPTDWKVVAESLNKQQPFVLSSPNSAVSKAIDALANALVQQQRR